MTYKSQMEEALHHSPQRLGLLLEAYNPRIEPNTPREKLKPINQNDLPTSSQVQPNHSPNFKSSRQPPNRSTKRVSHRHKVLQQGTSYVIGKPI